MKAGVMDDAMLNRLHALTLRYARTRYLPDPAMDADDLAAMAWLRSLPHLADQYTEAQHGRYLRGAASCCAVDAQRAWRRRPHLPLEDWLPGKENVEAEAIARVELAAVLAIVPPALLHFALGYLWSEIAAAFGVPLVTPRTQAHRWRRAQEAQA